MDLIKCKWCGEDTPHLSTKECDRCHHANFVVRQRPDLIRKMLRQNDHRYPTLSDLCSSGRGLSGRAIHVLSAETDCEGKPVSYETLILDPMALYRMRNCGATTVGDLRFAADELDRSIQALKNIGCDDEQLLAGNTLMANLIRRGAEEIEGLLEMNRVFNEEVLPSEQATSRRYLKRIRELVEERNSARRLTDQIGRIRKLGRTPEERVRRAISILHKTVETGTLRAHPDELTLEAWKDSISEVRTILGCDKGERTQHAAERMKARLAAAEKVVSAAQDCDETDLGSGWHSDKHDIAHEDLEEALEAYDAAKETNTP